MILDVQDVLDALYEEVIVPNWETIKKIYPGDFNYQGGYYMPMSEESEARLKKSFKEMDSYEWEVNSIETTSNSIVLNIRDSELCISMYIEYNEDQEVIGFASKGE